MSENTYSEEEVREARARLESVVALDPHAEAIDYYDTWASTYDKVLLTYWGKNQPQGILLPHTGPELTTRYITTHWASTYDKVYYSHTGPEPTTRYTTTHWASTYDKDLDILGYIGAATSAEHFAKHAKQLGLGKDSRILDIGAGTGKCGEKLLKEHGFWNLEANDINAKMLDVAREKGIYKKIHLGRLQDLSLPENSYDAVVSVATGNLSFLKDIIRIIRPGGLLLASMRASSQEKNMKYEAGEGSIECLEEEVLPNKWYTDVDAFVLVYKIL